MNGNGSRQTSMNEEANASNFSTMDDSLLKREQEESLVEDITDDSITSSKEPSSGPMRTKAGQGSDANSNAGGEGSSSKTPIAAPVKAACTFCRSRKSRCNGKQPCAACVSRSQPDDCHYTISRRGGKPKPKAPKVEPMESHLEKILDLSDLPHLVRIPNAVPQLQGFMMDDVYGNQGSTASGMYSDKSTFASSAQSPTYSASTGRARSESLQVDINPQMTRLLLQDFYNLFYRFIPILPGSHYLDQLASTIPADSPFLLSLQCVLPVIRNEPLIPVTASSEEEKKAHIRMQTAHLAKRTEAAIDAILERVENNSDVDDFHTLEVIQALCMLIIYEYGGGRALKARLKADTALGIAMSKGLHQLSSASVNNGLRSPQPLNRNGSTPHFLSRIDQAEMHEVRKRMWWSLWSMTMWTAYNTGRIPTIRADDARVTCELPKCSDGKAWAFVVSSLQGLLLVQDRVLALSSIEQGRAQEIGSNAGPLPGLPFQGASSFAKSASADVNNQGVPTSFSGLPTMASRDSILQSMQNIDQALQDQMVKLEQSTHGVITPPGQHHEQELGPGRASVNDTQYLHFVWAIQLYTASLTLHVGQAFQGATLFERKLCFLSSINEANDASACQVPMPNAFSDDIFSNIQAPMSTILPEMDLYARGPFLPKDSLKRCVDASDKLLAISRNLRNFKGPFAAPNNPFNACSFVLISFVCLMQALAISTNVLDEEQIITPSNNTNLEMGGIAPSLLKSAQGAAALNAPPMQVFNNTSSTRQQQLQGIWARVKEARGTLQELAKHWDMVIPMAEEVGGCLEASQFLLSQDSSANTSTNMNFSN